MKITLKNIEYTAPAPLTGLWFAMQKIKLEQERRVAELQESFKKIEKYKDVEKLEESIVAEVDKAMIDVTKKIEANKRILLESRIKIIVDTFRNENVSQEAIIELMPLQEVQQKYFEIENWLNDILSGKIEQLPNE